MSTYDTEQEARTPVLVREDARTVFAQVMFLVAATVGVAALGAYVGRDLSFGWGIAFWIVGIGCLIGLNVTRANRSLQIFFLFGLGAALGLAIGPTINAYVEAFGSTIVAQAAGLTALFIGALGTAGYATRRDLSGLYRFLFIALLGLIVFGIVMIFVSIPGGYADLLDRRARHLRRLHARRLQPPSPGVRGRQRPDRGRHLPRRPERLPPHPPPARPEPQLGHCAPRAIIAAWRGCARSWSP